MRFCPFCSAENTVEATHCTACARRLPPVPQRRQRPPSSPTGVTAVPGAVGPEASGGRRSLLAALSPSPSAERRPVPLPEPRGDGRRRTDFTEERTVVDDQGQGQGDPSIGDDTATNVAVAPPSPPPPRRSTGQTRPPPLPPRRKPTSVPPPVPGGPPVPDGELPATGSGAPMTSAALPGEAPTRRKRPSMSPPLYPMTKEGPAPLPPPPGQPASITGPTLSPSTTQPRLPGPSSTQTGPTLSPSTSRTQLPPPATPSPYPPLSYPPPPPELARLGDEFAPLPTPAQRQLDGFEPPPTRILRGEALGDRPFAPPTVIPIPEIPEPGLVPAARYSVTFLRARWQRRGAIKSLSEDIKRDTDALDQILGSLGRTARGVGLEGRVFAAENAAISAAENKRGALEHDGVELQSRKSDETTKYVDVESERTTKVSQAEHQLGEAQRDLQHVEGKRRGLREKRKDVERRQRNFLKVAQQRDESAANAPIGESRGGFRADAESHRRDAAALEPERQEIDRRLAVLEKPIADATARVDAAKAELESARRSLDDAREGHGHRLAELESEQKRKAKEVAQAEAEILRRLVTLGTLVNLNRVDRPEFADLYQRIDRLRTAIGARTTEIEKLTAERDAFDKASLVRGLSTLGGTVVFLITLIVLLRACL